MAKGEQVDNQVAAPAEPRTPNLHRAKRSLLESANGSMATAAAIGQENNLVEQNEKRIDLTPAGLLMEGVHGPPVDRGHCTGKRGGRDLQVPGAGKLWN